MAGVLAWPGRYGYKKRRGLPSRWHEDEEAGESYYWITPEVAEMFKVVRKKVEETD